MGAGELGPSGGRQLRPREGASELRQCAGRRGRAPAKRRPWATRASEQAGRRETRWRASKPGGAGGGMVFSPTFCASYTAGHRLNLVKA
jgi:hypothetical protein